MSSTDFIHSIGYAGVFAILFAETGLLFGFFLPGDTLLMSAGLLAARGQMHLSVLLAVMILGAVLGDATGYWIGRKAGQRLFQRDDSFWFRKEHLEKARRFYERHGGKTIFLARFFTAVRTFAPMVAGAAHMPYRRFTVFNVAGAVSWIVAVTLIGYSFGNLAQKWDHYIFLGALILLPLPLLIALSQSFRIRRAHRRFIERQAHERERAREDDEATVGALADDM